MEPTEEIHSVLELLQTNALTCPACNELYTEPKVLPCLHTVCKKCVLDHVRREDSTGQDPPRCPVCSHELDASVRTPGGVTKLPGNGFCEHILEIKRCQSDDKKQCEDCRFDGKNVLAITRCLECCDDLCRDCTAAHRKTKLTRAHLVAPYTEIRNGKYDETIRSSQRINCKSHKERPLTDYCTTCQCLVCPDCKDGSHASHDVTATSDAVGPVKDYAKELKNYAGSQVTALGEQSQHIEEYTNQLLQQKSKLKQAIEEQAKNLHELVDAHKSKLNNDLDLSCSEEVVRAADIGEAVEKDFIALRDNYQFVSRLLQFGRDDEVLSLQELMASRMEDLTTRKINTLESTMSLHFNGNPLTDGQVETLFGDLDICPTTDGLTDIRSLLASFSTTNGLRVPSMVPKITGTPELVLEFKCSSSYDNKDIWPTGLCVTDDGHFVVVDRDNKRIKIFDEEGRFLSDFAGTGKNTLGSPFDATILQSGDIAVTDYETEDVKVFTVLGKHVNTIDGHFKYPRGITTDQEGHVMVVDCGHRRVTVHDPDTGRIVRTIKGKDEQGFDLFTDPHYIGVTMGSKTIVTDWASPNIKVFGADGKLQASYGTYGTKKDQVLQPHGICSDSKGHVFIADNENHRIHLLGPDGRFQRFLLTKEDGVWHPMALGVNGDGCLVVTEGLGKVKVFKYM